MIRKPLSLCASAVLASTIALSMVGCASSPQLESWNNTETRDTLTEFVSRTTTPGSADFVPEPERIAVFDNDGTLWGEQPYYFQLRYAIDRVQAEADQHPEWRTTEPLRSALAGDVKALAGQGHEALLELFAATHGGRTDEQFAAEVDQWLTTARHPDIGLRYDEMIYAPMVEMLEYLRDNGYKTFIVSGGGIDFIRVFSERAYGIPPEQVMGSMLTAEYISDDAGPRVVKNGEIAFIDDKAGKPVGIHHVIGRRPTIAVGNSDGDFQMLEWSTAGAGPRLGILVHHDDAAREYAYDRDSHIGKLVRGLDEAAARGWLIVSMRDDWTRIYPSD